MIGTGVERRPYSTQPAVGPSFNTGCAPACTVITCSCTVASFYWSSTSVATDLAFAWVVGFLSGPVNAVDKSFSGFGGFVRAVRGGL